jgi:hypothetical protein
VERCLAPPSPSVPPVERCLACEADIEGVPGSAGGYGGQVARPRVLGRAPFLVGRGSRTAERPRKAWRRIKP